MQTASKHTPIIAGLLALCAWSALLLQLVLSLQLGIAQGKGWTGGLLAYLGFFTIWSNLFIALMATAGVCSSHCPRLAYCYRPSVVGCASAAITLVMLVYHLLLRHIWAPQGAQLLADNLLHYAVPLLALLHWWLYRPTSSLSPYAPLFWCCYPVVYLVYALLRGEILGTYPYPFIDLTVLSWAALLRNALGITLVFIAIGYALWGVKRWQGKTP